MSRLAIAKARTPAAPQATERILALTTRHPARALALARRLLASAESRDPEMRARLLRSLGHALRAVGRYREARTAYLESRRLFSRLGLDMEHAICALGLVDACMYLGRNREALDAANAARRAFLRHQDLVRLARLECNVGNVQHHLDSLERALHHYERADRLFARAGLELDRARLAHNRANILTHLGRRAEAEGLYRQSGVALSEAGEVVQAAQVRYGLACLRFLNGEYAAAIAELEEVRPDLERLGANALLALADLDLAEVLLAMRLYPEAAALARSARRWFGARSVPVGRARSELVLGIACARLGRFAAARHALDSAERLFRAQRHSAGRAAVTLGRAQAVWLDGDPRGAARQALAACAAFRRAGLRTRALAAGALAAEALLGAKSWVRSAALARNLLREAPAPGDAYSRARLARCEAAAAANRGDTETALRGYRMALELAGRAQASLFVDEWRVGFLDEEAPILDELLGVVLRRQPKPRPAEIWRTIARARCMVPRPAPAGPGGPAVRAQVEHLRAELEACYARLWQTTSGARRPHQASQRLDRRAFALEGRLRRLAGSRWGARRSAGTAGLLRSTPGEARIQYFSAAGMLGALVCENGQLRLVTDLAPLDQVDRLVRLFHYQMELQAATHPSLAAHREVVASRGRTHLVDLGRALLEPLFRGSPPARLRVSPHGPLFRIPFHALSYCGEPLVSAAECSVDWGDGADPLQEARSETWVIGHGEGAPAAHEEARRVAALLAGGGTRMVERIGSAAVVSSLAEAAATANHIHLSGHAMYRAQHPEFSALKLADGWVNARDLMALPLSGTSVILSACETGPRGTVAGGEILGLARGLLIAGTRSVVATLWRVDDHATLVFMEDLYRAWRETGRLGEALRRTQRDRARRGDEICSWAPFCLLGDPDTAWPGAMGGQA